jgi:hypothetical protein
MRYISGTFRFDSPLCGCPEQDVSWGVQPDVLDPADPPSLRVRCKRCGAVVYVQGRDFRVRLDFTKPGPEGLPRPERRLHLVRSA